MDKLFTQDQAKPGYLLKSFDAPQKDQEYMVYKLKAGKGHLYTTRSDVLTKPVAMATIMPPESEAAKAEPSSPPSAPPSTTPTTPLRQSQRLEDKRSPKRAKPEHFKPCAVEGCTYPVQRSDHDGRSDHAFCSRTCAQKGMATKAPPGVRECAMETCSRAAHPEHACCGLRCSRLHTGVAKGQECRQCNEPINWRLRCLCNSEQ